MATPAEFLEVDVVNPTHERHNEIDEVILSWNRTIVSTSIQTIIIQCFAAHETSGKGVFSNWKILNSSSWRIDEKSK